MKGITTMTSSRLVGLVRIGLVAASLAFAGEATLSAAPVAAGELQSPLVTSVPSSINVQPANIKLPCRRLNHLAAGASAAGDSKQAHDFKQEAIALGCR